MKKIRDVALFILASFSAVTAFAQAPYKVPPEDVVAILDAPPLPQVMVSPAGDMLLLVDYDSMPSIADLAKPIIKLAGTRIQPDTNSRQQMTFYTGLSLKSIRTGDERKVELPPGIKFGMPAWSFDGRQVVFPRHVDNGVELWLLDVKTAQARALTGPFLNCALQTGYQWLPGSDSILAFFVIKDRGIPPSPPRAPKGPNIRETLGRFAKIWTYQDLLKTPFDESLFEYFATSQMMKIDIATGHAQKIGDPGIFFSVDPSPNGNLFLVRRIRKPFSYSVPFFLFAHSIEILDNNGALVHVLADNPPKEEVPADGVPTGPRDFEWQPFKPSTVIWREALDDGNPKKDAPFRDKVMAASFPFKAIPKEVFRTRGRQTRIDWLGQEGLALSTEYEWKKRWTTTYLLDVDKPGQAPVKLFDLSSLDQYGDPGYPVRRTTPAGESIVVQDKKHIFLAGNGASPKGDYPFLDRLDLKTFRRERLFHCQDASYETFIAFSDASFKRILTRHETKTSPPNYHLVDLRTGKNKGLTFFKDPAPGLAGLKKELIKYKREDGIDLSGTLYLPPGYKEGERLPVVIWAYPLEYNDPSIAGQVRGSPNRFPLFRGSSHLFFLTQGYAVLDNAQMPVVGDPETMNDTFVSQIVSNARAAIQVLDAMGIGDPKRIGVGGHSYGAFMTANLLAHCDLFAAGIARSGAYNRTLTPFGFQSERRTLWEAPEIYMKLSPYMAADKINEPLLLIHGEADNNSGTFPIQSERLFAALKGFGTTARLVMLPYESHGYSARESILHVLAEMFEWFDAHVKNKK